MLQCSHRFRVLSCVSPVSVYLPRYWKSKKIANGIQGQGLRLSPIRIQDNPQSAVFKVTQDKGGIGRAQADFFRKKPRQKIISKCKTCFFWYDIMLRMMRWTSQFVWMEIAVDIDLILNMYLGDQEVKTCNWTWKACHILSLKAE